MDKPLVSVILPAYNHARYVKETLDSIVAQNYPNMELIAIDDGSKDDTPLIMEEWIATHSQSLPITYRSRANKGISSTLNELISLAQGEYIAGASSDDLLLEDSVSARVDYLVSHPEKKAVFGDCTTIDKCGELLYESAVANQFGVEKEKLSDSDFLKHQILHRFFIAGPVLMFKQDVFQEIGMYEESLPVEDWDIYLRLSSHNLLGYLDQSVAAVRNHDTNASKRKHRSLKWCQYERQVLERNMQYFSGEDLTYIRRRISYRKWKEAQFVLRSILNGNYKSIAN